MIDNQSEQKMIGMSQAFVFGVRLLRALFFKRRSDHGLYAVYG